MNNLLEHKGYFGSVEYSAEDKVFCGEIEFINDLITFEATNVKQLEKAFKDSVEYYFESCKKLNRKPQKVFKGQFNVRIKPELHKKASITALKNKISLNKLVENALVHELGVEY